MKKENFNKVKPDKMLLAGKRKYFLGNVDLHDISEKIGTQDQKIYYVKFHDGARTKLHHHEGSQVLVATKGSGALVLYDKTGTNKQIVLKVRDKIILREGDLVHIPKNTLHWHGAMQGKNLNHIAFNGFTSRGKEARTIWYDSDFKSYAVRIS